MVSGAVRLLATTGLAGTSFSEVLAATGAPRGSIYHHFPGGKDELVGAAIDRAAQSATDQLEGLTDFSAVAVTTLFLAGWQQLLERTGQRAGCAVLAVTVDTDTPELLARTGRAFRTWRSKLSQLLITGGLESGLANRWAATLIAAAEGAVVLSRAERTMEPFDLVRASLLESARAIDRQAH
jgi:AcrR family transcriptional regulator